MVERALYKQLLERKVSELEADATESFGIEGIVGTSPAMKKVFKGIQYAASIDENVLITGETGVGKGVVARAIRRRSDRRDSPFVSLLPSALARLEEHDWPGNVRELENVLARAVIATTGKGPSSDDFTVSLRAPFQDGGAGASALAREGEEDLLEGVEEQLASEYRAALLRAKGNKSHAAKLLGLPESTFRCRLKKYRRFLRGV